MKPLAQSCLENFLPQYVVRVSGDKHENKLGVLILRPKICGNGLS